MAGSLGRLNVELSAETVRFNNAMNKASFQAQKSFNSIIRSARLVAPALVTALAPGALAFQIKKVIDDADELGKMSQKIGVSVQSLSAWRHAADLAGSDFETLTKGIGRFSRVVSDAANGLITAKRPLDQLNIAFKGTDGALRDVDDLLLDVADRFSQMADGTKKAALAQELFGRSGVELIPFLNEGREGLQKIREEAERLGLGFDARTAKSAENLNDNITRLKGAFTGLFINLSSQILPVLVSYSDQLVESAKKSKDLKGGVNDVSDSVGNLALSIKSAIDAWEGLFAVSHTVIEVTSTGFKTVGLIARGRFKEIKDIGKDAGDSIEEAWVGVTRRMMEREKDLFNPEAAIERTRKIRGALEAEAAAMEAKNKLEQEGLAITKAMRTPLEKAKNLNSVMSELGDTISSSFVNAVVEGEKFSEVLRGLEKDILRLFVSRKIAEPIFGALFGGGTESGLLSGIFSAKGNAFYGGRLSMFAQGGVINSPVAFPMAGGRTGIAGEGGRAEGILPLMRTSGGDLGVKASGMGRTVVNVYAPPGSQVSEERSMDGGIERINIFIDEATAANIRPGTKTFRALKNNFGLTNTLVNR